MAEPVKTTHGRVFEISTEFFKNSQILGLFPQRKGRVAVGARLLQTSHSISDPFIQTVEATTLDSAAHF